MWLWCCFELWSTFTNTRHNTDTSSLIIIRTREENECSYSVSVVSVRNINTCRCHMGFERYISVVDYKFLLFWPGSRCLVLMAAIIGLAMQHMVLEVMQMMLNHSLLIDNWIVYSLILLSVVVQWIWIYRDNLAKSAFCPQKPFELVILM